MRPAALRHVLLSCVLLNGLGLVGCGDDPTTEGGCQLSAVATLPGGDLVVNGVDPSRVPAVSRGGDTPWSRGVGFPTRGFAVDADAGVF